MKVLHYTLGLPPKRSGGLTKYALDLMLNEISQNINVINICPGDYVPFLKHVHIIRVGDQKGIKNFAIINSLPLVLRGSIKDPKKFMDRDNLNYYYSFFKELSPDLIHIHSLMGLEVSFLRAANLLNIPIVFSSHDYFGISPNPTFFDDTTKSSFAFNNSIKHWMNCSNSSYSEFDLRVFQLPLYNVIRKLNHSLSKEVKFSNLLNEKLPKISSGIIEKHTNIHDFFELRRNYKEMFSLINLFAFNSTVAQKVFNNNLEISSDRQILLPITNNNIVFKKTKITPIISNAEKKLRLAYIGPYNYQKGFNLLLRVFADLPSKNFELHLFGDKKKITGLPLNIRNHGRYSYSDLDNICKMFDVLVIPSIWMETFGFTSMEAISRGKVVILSDHVGSGDLFPKINRFSPNAIGLKSKIIELKSNPSLFCHSIYINKSISSMENHTRKLIYTYKVLLGER